VVDPYDYCLHRDDARCDTAPGQPFGAAVKAVLPVTAGGATRQDDALPAVSARDRVEHAVARAPPAAARSTARMLVSTTITSTPAARWRAALSGDGHDLIAVPDGFLRDRTTYRVRISGQYTHNSITATGAHVGAAAPAGSFGSTVTLRHRHGLASAAAARRHHARQRAGDHPARVPLPAFLTSVNQIGFDDYHLLAGTLAVGGGRVLMYVITAKADADGTLTPDPGGGLNFVIGGRYRGRRDRAGPPRPDRPLTSSDHPAAALRPARHAGGPTCGWRPTRASTPRSTAPTRPATGRCCR